MFSYIIFHHIQAQPQKASGKFVFWWGWWEIQFCVCVCSRSKGKLFSVCVWSIFSQGSSRVKLQKYTTLIWTFGAQHSSSAALIAGGVLNEACFNVTHFSVDNQNITFCCCFWSPFLSHSRHSTGYYITSFKNESLNWNFCIMFNTHCDDSKDI